jgi:centrosomal protein CEP164
MQRRIEVLPHDSLELREYSESEVLRYGKHLGIDIDVDTDLLWIARSGLKEPVPEPWLLCRRVDRPHLFFHNPITHLSTWQHPHDHKFKKLVADTLAQRITVVAALSVETSANPFKRAVTIIATKLSGDRVTTSVSCPGVVHMERVRAELERELQLPSTAVARFVLPDGGLLTHAHDGQTVSAVFGLRKSSNFALPKFKHERAEDGACDEPSSAPELAKPELPGDSRPAGSFVRRPVVSEKDQSAPKEELALSISDSGSSHRSHRS